MNQVQSGGLHKDRDLVIDIGSNEEWNYTELL